MSHSNETSSSSDSTEQSLNSQSSESSSKVNFQQFMDKYHEFDLKKELGEIRTDINNHLSQYDPMLKVARKFLQDPFISMDNVVTDTYRISSDLNSKYPYMASLFRSHESLIVGGSVGVAALVLRSKIVICFVSC